MSSVHDFGSPVADIEDYLAATPEPISPQQDDPAPPTSPPKRRPAKPVLVVAIVLIVAVAIGGWLWTPVRPTGDDGQSVPTPPLGIAGFAEMFVATYVTQAGTGAEGVLGNFMVEPQEVTAMTPLDRYVPRAAAVAITPLGVDYWAVTVAAQVLDRTASGYVPAGTDYYQVAVVSSGDRLTVAALPTRVAALPSPGEPAMPILSDEPSAEIMAFAAEFLDALLVGTHRLSRYVVPGASIRAIEPHPYRTITIVGAATGLAHGATYVSATIEAATATGTVHVLAYTLELARDGGGEWEVAAIIPGPPPAEPNPAAS